MCEATHKVSHIQTDVFSKPISIWINDKKKFSLHVLHVKDNQSTNLNNMYI
jgi:hypothetical protein